MIQLTLIANAGIYIQYHKTRFLLDGIHSEGNYPFSKTPSDLLSQMFSDSNRGNFNDIDYLIFSHSHPDHFSPDIVAKYLRHNHVKRLFLPDFTEHREIKLLQVISELDVPYWTFQMRLGNFHQFKINKEILLTALCTRHMPLLFAKDLCNTILLSFKGLNILFLSDCSYKEDGLWKKFQSVSIHTVFINPYFYYDANGYSIIKRYLCPKQIVIYHIPFKRDDKTNIRSLASKMIIRHPEDNVILFKEPFQTLKIPM